jgi:HSP20 family protein
VEVELPGAARDDVAVALDDRTLTVSGQVRDKERRGILHRHSRRVGRSTTPWPCPGTSTKSVWTPSCTTAC